MRISDWSSDVCSSDLQVGAGGSANLMTAGGGRTTPGSVGDIFPDGSLDVLNDLQIETALASRFVIENDEVSEVPPPAVPEPRMHIGRASCRERGCQYV